MRVAAPSGACYSYLESFSSRSISTPPTPTRRMVPASRSPRGRATLPPARQLGRCSHSVVVIDEGIVTRCFREVQGRLLLEPYRSASKQRGSHPTTPPVLHAVDRRSPGR